MKPLFAMLILAFGPLHWEFPAALWTLSLVGIAAPFLIKKLEAKLKKLQEEK